MKNYIYNLERNKIIDRYTKGFEEYRKGEYFKSKIRIVLNPVSNSNLSNIVYLDNRIKECNSKLRKLLRKLESNISEEDNIRILDLIDTEIDKLSFFENCMEDLGGIKYNQNNTSKDNIVLVAGEKAKIIRANKVTVSIEYIDQSLIKKKSKIAYSEIQEVLKK